MCVSVSVCVCVCVCKMGWGGSGGVRWGRRQMGDGGGIGKSKSDAENY